MGFGLNKPDGVAGKAWPSIMVGMFAAFGGVLYGYDTGTISGIQGMSYWLDEFDLVDANGNAVPNQANKLSLIVSILSVGTFFGALAAGYVSDLLGRKWGIIVCAAIPFNLGVILQVASTAQPMFIAGRFFAGFGVGLISVQVPMYQAESLPSWIRGLVIGSYQFCITIGLLLASLVNYATQNRNDSGSYRIPLAVQFAWSIILCVGFFFLPETPRWLVKKNRPEQAAKSLTFLRRLDIDHPALRQELAEVEASYEYECSLGTASYLECFRGTIGKRTFTGIGIQTLQQLAGINFIMYYGTTYFQNQRGSWANQSALPDAFILQVITNVVNVISTLPGLYAIDKLGRRPILLIGAVGMGIAQYIVAACGAATSDSNYTSAQAQFAFICIYIFFFASTFGPGAWVVTGEMFPLKVRAKCLSMTTAANWLFNWLLSFIIPYLLNEEYANLGSNVFWIWGGFCWLAAIFVWFLVYETKGLSLEHVNELYESCSMAWKSKQYRATVELSDTENGRDDAGRKEKESVDMAEKA